MEPTIADATVEHVMPGRVRLRFRSKRNDIAFFEELVGSISKFAAVDAIDANPQTGSVLIRHSATAEELISFASLNGLFDPEELALPNNGEAVVGNDDGEAPTGSPTIGALGLIALAIAQALRGRVLGSAAEQFWLASRLTGTNYPAARLVLIGLGLFQLLSGRVLAPASSLFTYALMSEAMKIPPPKEAAGPSKLDLEHRPAT